MEFKRFLIKQLTLFFMLSTLIAIAVSLIGSAFDGEARLSYVDLLSPIKYAALCILPSLVTYSRRELSPKQMLLRKALSLVLIEAVILFLAFTSPAIDTDRIQVVLVIAGSVLVIFVLSHLFLWLKDSADAKKMTLDLVAFQNLHGPEGLSPGP